jgi:hypothetical protein
VERDKPCTTTLQAVERNKPYAATLQLVERDKTCTTTLQAVERNKPYAATLQAVEVLLHNGGFCNNGTPKQCLHLPLHFLTNALLNTLFTQRYT